MSEPNAAARKRVFLYIPTTFLVLFFVLPLVALVVLSFWQTANYKIVREWTVLNYVTLATETAYITFFLRSLLMATLVSIFLVVVAWPFAFFIVRFGGRYKLIFSLLLAVVSIWRGAAPDRPARQARPNRPDQRRAFADGRGPLAVHHAFQLGHLHRLRLSLPADDRDHDLPLLADLRSAADLCRKRLRGGTPKGVFRGDLAAAVSRRPEWHALRHVDGAAIRRVGHLGFGRSNGRGAGVVFNRGAVVFLAIIVLFVKARNTKTAPV